MPNNLIGESSPYLLQHAHNPVNWYPWGEEALGLAVKEQKPILVSIGYAACHWCHVMERESFENAETAAFMNEHFINIKIDREERPDLDHIYMDAVQAMTGSGGWPLNVFLTPDAKPFYGGTYFPPQPAFNRGSWMDVLKSVTEAFANRRHEIDAQAENLTAHMISANNFGIGTPEGNVFRRENIREIARNILKSADKTWGGFGRAPKFPQTSSIRYLLRFHHQCGPNKEEELAGDSLDQAILSLDKMIEGGIYDQLGGGFARYSTDTEWLAPHFEKMLYDNALIVSVLAEAYQVTGKKRYAEVIAETMEFISREMLDPSGGWYSALDADSEGEEGKFYVWDKKEIDEVLGVDAPVFEEFYDVSVQGNWEHKNVLRVLKNVESFAADKKMNIGQLKELLGRGKEKLMARRGLRIRPLLDDKIILGWNALMNSAASRAYAATGEPAYLEMAKTNMAFLLGSFRKTDGSYQHTWKKGVAKFPAFLDDLALLQNALLDLQEVTGNNAYLDEAGRIAQHVIEHFSEEETPFFYYTSKGQGDVIYRKKEMYDGALPSGNALMAGGLLHLSVLLDRPEWGKRAQEMVSSVAPAIIKYPTSFGQWACVLLELYAGVMEIVITGEEINNERLGVLKLYLPHKVLQTASESGESYPLLAGKGVTEKTAFWLCRKYTCEAPVFSLGELISLINKGGKD